MSYIRNFGSFLYQKVIKYIFNHSQYTIEHQRKHGNKNRAE